MWSNIIYAMFFEIVLHELNLTYKAHGPPKFFCGPLGFNGRSVGNRASTVLVSRRVGLGQNPSCKYWSSSKCNALFSLDWVFCLCFYFDRHQKGGHFYQRGATAFWGAVAQTSPPGSATTKSLMRSILNVHAGHRFRPLPYNVPCPPTQSFIVRCKMRRKSFMPWLSTPVVAN